MNPRSFLLITIATRQTFTSSFQHQTRVRVRGARLQESCIDRVTNKSSAAIAYFTSVTRSKNLHPLQMTVSEEKKCDKNVLISHGDGAINANFKGGELWKFATHTSEEYHDFSEDEAAAIQAALLTWFRSNRRQLPWRGDAPPYNGSTAGVNDDKKNNDKKKKSRNQKDITSFFGKAEAGSKKKKKNVSVADNEDVKCEEIDSVNPGSTIPITGYSVWVSEIMLQQTRVEAVIKYYLKWMDSFPTVQDLAVATEDEVNAHWAGLGFYRRARFLHKGAKYVVEELDGIVPNNVDDLLKVSGIGRYTASAVASIAYDQCVPVVDGNVCRVLSRLKGVANNIKAPIFKDNFGWRLANQIVSANGGKHAGEVNQALMELGATYCSPSGTGIHPDDPLVKFYLSTRLGVEARELVKNETLMISDFVSEASLVRGDSCCNLCEDGGISSILFQIAEDVEEIKDDTSQFEYAARIGHSRFPTPPPKKAKREEVLSVIVMSQLDSHGNEKWFMTKRANDGLLAGQWEFPAQSVWSSGKGVKQEKSASKKKIEIPVKDEKVLNEAAKELLGNYTIVDNESTTLGDVWSDAKTKIYDLGDTPIEHIFSHVRWNLYCKYADVSTSQFSSALIENDSHVINNSSSCKCSWMSEADMHDVGITSSVKKIMAKVKNHRSKPSSKQNRKRRKIS